MRWCVAVLVVVAACGSSPQPPPQPAPSAVHAPARPSLGPSPGPLAEVHAALDTPVGCNDCHDGTKETPADKCVHCHDHERLRARLAAGMGFHASPLVRGKPCAMCHREHAGRAFDLMGWREVGGEASFDHDRTGWPLGGRHASAPCDGCHVTRDRQGLRTYAGTDRLCGSCYARVACTACHANGELAAASCESCHALPPGTPTKITQSHHGHRFDTFACADCHRTQTWSPHVFDHAKHTKLALAGKHATIACRACHRGKRPDDFENFLGSTSCLACHEHRNVHADALHPTGKYSDTQCLSCHQPERLPRL
jgi:hypothetical protein